MKCEYCGTVIENDSQFCIYCGAPVDESIGCDKSDNNGQETNASHPVLRYIEKDANNNDTAKIDYIKDANKKPYVDDAQPTIKRSRRWLVFACVVIAIGLLVCVALVFNKQSKMKKAEQTSTEMVQALDDDIVKSDSQEEDMKPQEKPVELDEYSEEVWEDWKDAYRQILTEADEEIQYYSLIYVNSDSVPELVMSAGYEAAGNIIYTFYNGELDSIQTNRLYFSYVEKENLLNNSDGHMDSYFDIIYRISNVGKWIVAGKGWFGAEDNSNVQLDEDGNPLYRFYWNDEEVGEQGYIDAIARFYPMSRAVVSEYGSKEEILEMIDKGVVSNKKYAIYRDNEEVHNYEIVIGDYTWSEAFEEALKRGGYLVHINTSEEFDAITDMIRDSGEIEYYYWIGAKSTRHNHQYYWYNPDYTFGLEPLESTEKYDSFWMEGEPSYTGEDPDGNITQEDSLYMLYDHTKEAFLWNDAPGNIFEDFSFFKGRMGFIIEYEN